MRKNILIVVIVAVISICFYWFVSIEDNSTELNTTAQPEIVITSPGSDEQVGVSFLLAGSIPTFWLKEGGFEISIVDNEREVLSQIINVKENGDPIIPFEVLLDTSGMTAETKTCFGPATLVISSFNNSELSKSIDIDCG